MGRKCKRKEVCEWEKASVSSLADLEVMSNLWGLVSTRVKIYVWYLWVCLQIPSVFEHIALNLSTIYNTVFSTSPILPTKNLLLFSFLKHCVLYTLIYTLGVQQRIKSPFYEDACDYREVSSAPVPVSYTTSLLLCAGCSGPVPALTGWVTTPWASLGAGTSAVFSSFSFYLLRVSHAHLHLNISKLHCFPIEKTGMVSFLISFIFRLFFFFRLGTAKLAVKV